MTRNFYESICLSLGLSLLTGLFHNWLHFQLGIHVYRLPSFPGWFWLLNGLSLITSVLLLNYFLHRGYRAAFLTGLAASVTTFAGPFLMFLARFYPGLRTLSDAALVPGVCCMLVYAISLVVSRAGVRPWLKRAGVAMIALTLGQLATLAWFNNTPDFPPNTTLDSIRQGLALTERMVLLLLLFNFWDEYRKTAPDNRDKAYTGIVSRWNLAKTLIALFAVCSLVLSLQLVEEKYGQTHVSARESALAKPFEEGRFISRQGDTLFYRLLKPSPYDPQKQYPLVVALPYSCWSDNTRQIGACPMAQWLATSENKSRYPAFVFVPRCPPYTGWGGVSNTPSVAPLAIEAIKALNQTYSIDPKRRYISGVSRGGYGTWHMVGENPELFAAAIPVCGEGDPQQAGRMTAVAVWAFHGAEDRNVPVSGSRRMVSAIKEAGGRPRYTEYPDAAHNIWEKVKETPGLLDWLFRQRRGNQPKATEG